MHTPRLWPLTFSRITHPFWKIFAIIVLGVFLGTRELIVYPRARTVTNVFDVIGTVSCARRLLIPMELYRVTFSRNTHSHLEDLCTFSSVSFSCSMRAETLPSVLSYTPRARFRTQSSSFAWCSYNTGPSRSSGKLSRLFLDVFFSLIYREVPRCVLSQLIWCSYCAFCAWHRYLAHRVLRVSYSSSVSMALSKPHESFICHALTFPYNSLRTANNPLSFLHAHMKQSSIPHINVILLTVLCFPAALQYQTIITIHTCAGNESFNLLFYSE